MTKSGCTPAWITVWNTNFKRAYAECDEWRDRRPRARRRGTPDLVIVASSHPYRSAGNGATAPPDGGVALAAGLEETLDRLEPLADAVVLIGDTPKFEDDPPDCLRVPSRRRRSPAPSRGRAWSTRPGDGPRPRSPRVSWRHVRRSDRLGLPDRSVPGRGRALPGLPRRAPPRDAVRRSRCASGLPPLLPAWPAGSGWAPPDIEYHTLPVIPRRQPAMPAGTHPTHDLQSQARRQARPAPRLGRPGPTELLPQHRLRDRRHRGGPDPGHRRRPHLVRRPPRVGRQRGWPVDHQGRAARPLRDRKLARSTSPSGGSARRSWPAS